MSKTPKPAAQTNAAPGRITRLRRREPLPSAAPIDSFQGALALDLGPRLAPPEAPPVSSAPIADDAELREWELLHRSGFEKWSWRYLQTAVEIAGGGRPAAQLLRWSRPVVYNELGRLAQSAARRQRPEGHPCPQLVTLHSSFVSRMTCEVTARVRYGDRYRALAARFELLEGRMQCTALELG